MPIPSHPNRIAGAGASVSAGRGDPREQLRALGLHCGGRRIQGLAIAQAPALPGGPGVRRPGPSPPETDLGHELAGVLPGDLPGPARAAYHTLAEVEIGSIPLNGRPSAGEEVGPVSKLAIVEYLSLDGVIQAPGHAGQDPEGGFAHGGWTGEFMADHRRYNSQLFPTAGAFLFGRRTYEIFAEYWPTVTDGTDRIAAALNIRPKFVASTTLRNPAWPGTTVLSGDVAEEVAKLKEQSGDPILVLGSGRLAQTLLAHDLVDEYQLWLHPVVLGSGKRLFDGGDQDPIRLRLADATMTRDGLVILTYQRA
jgi:dihydrofolate reductase